MKMDMDVVTHSAELISVKKGQICCAAVTGRWGLLSHTQIAVRWHACTTEIYEHEQRYLHW